MGDRPSTYSSNGISIRQRTGSDVTADSTKATPTMPSSADVNEQQPQQQQQQQQHQNIQSSEFIDRVASCLAYSFCSISMILGNKFIASSQNGGGVTVSTGLSVLPVAFQNFCAVFFLEILRGCNVVSYNRSLDAKQIQLVLPLSLCFVAMLLSGYMCLKFLNVPMVTIFKNTTNLLIVGGEWLFFGEHVSFGVILSILLMVIGCVAAATNDLTFTLLGLFWAVFNCCATAGYVLYMRRLTSKKAVEMSRFGTVFMNNLASFGFLLMIATQTGELGRSVQTDIDTNYLLVSGFTGMIGFALNFAQLWCVASTSATTYSIVGTLNKVPIAFFGTVLFKSYLTRQGYIFVAVNFVGCAAYSYFKLNEPKKAMMKEGSGTSLEQPSTSSTTPTTPVSNLLGRRVSSKRESMA